MKFRKTTAAALFFSAALAARSMADEDVLALKILPPFAAGEDAQVDALLSQYTIDTLKRDIGLIHMLFNEMAKEQIGPGVAIDLLLLDKLMDYGISKFSDPDIYAFKAKADEQLKANKNLSRIAEYLRAMGRFMRKIYKDDVEAHNNVKSGRFEDAAKFFERGLADAESGGVPHFAAYYAYSLAKCRMSLARPQDVLKAVEAGERNLPNLLDKKITAAFRIQLGSMKLVTGLLIDMDEEKARRGQEELAKTFSESKSLLPPEAQVEYHLMDNAVDVAFGNHMTVIDKLQKVLADPSLFDPSMKSTVNLRVKLLSLLSMSQRAAQQLSKAIESSKQALALLKSGDPQPQVEIEIHGFLCDSFTDLGDFAAAQKYCAEGEMLAKALGIPMTEADIAMRAGIMYWKQRKLREAEREMRKADALFASGGGAFDADRGTLLMHLGMVLAEQGKYYDGLSLISQANEIFTKMNYLPGAVNASEDMALLQIAVKSYDMALVNLQKARGALEAMGMAGSDYYIFFLTGNVYKEKGDVEHAINQYVEGVKVLEGLRGNIATEKHRQLYFKPRQEIYERLIELLMTKGMAEEALDYAERAKSRNLLDMLSTRRFKPKSADQKSLEDLMGIERKAKAINDAAQGENEGLTEAGGKRGIAVPARDAKARLDELEKDRFRELDEIGMRNPELRSLVAVEPAPVKKIADGLPADLAVIEYFTRAGGTTIWLVTKGRVKIFESKTTQASLADSVEAFRKDIQNGVDVGGKGLGPMAGVRGLNVKANPDAKVDKGGASGLFKALFPAGLAGQIKGKRLLIVPHGPLHKLPFAALTDPQSGRYLAEDHDLTIVPSLQVFFFLSARGKPARTEFFSIANPLFSATRFGELTGMPLDASSLSSLPGAEDEVKDVSGFFANPVWKKGGEATETFLTRQLGAGNRFNVVHLATHAVFNEEFPMASTVFLQGDAQNDGLLQSPEVFSLDLGNCSLVVLSACQSGLAKVESGDELLGLQRGLLYAGARDLLMTLWEVSDEGTRALMSRYYKEFIGNGLGPAAALRKAQLRMIGSKDLAHPFFWAGFFVTGMVD